MIHYCDGVQDGKKVLRVAIIEYRAARMEDCLSYEKSGNVVDR
jgi:hypothetical protein